MRRRLLVGLGPLPGTVGNPHLWRRGEGTVAYWITDVARTLIALLAGLES